MTENGGNRNARNEKVELRICRNENERIVHSQSVATCRLYLYVFINCCPPIYVP
jgi:hypothetical protein